MNGYYFVFVFQYNLSSIPYKKFVNSIARITINIFLDWIRFVTSYKSLYLQRLFGPRKY